MSETSSSKFIKIIEVIKFYKDYSSMIFNAGYEATHGKGLKKITSKIINSSCTSKSK